MAISFYCEGEKMKKLTAIFLVLVAAFSIFAGGASEEGAKKYVFAQDCTWPPLEYVDESGKIVGFEVDIISEMSKLTGIEMESRNTGWDGIFAGLVNGSYDAVASGVTITEERKMTLDFTDPILEVVQSIIVRAGDEDKVNSFETLSGNKVGVQIGTTGHFVAETAPGIILSVYDEIPLAVEDLLNGNVDAVVCDSLIAADFVLANENYAGKLSISGNASDEVEQIAMCVKKGNMELLEIINSSLKTLEENGTIDALKEKYNII